MKLPLWRAVAGFAVLGGLVAVLISLAPVYLNDYRLRTYIKTLTADPSSDDTLRGRIIARAHELDLPVSPGQVAITHTGGKRELEAKYVVEKRFALYEVELHFHPHASR